MGKQDDPFTEVRWMMPPIVLSTLTPETVAANLGLVNDWLHSLHEAAAVLGEGIKVYSLTRQTVDPEHDIVGFIEVSSMIRCAAQLLCDAEHRIQPAGGPAPEEPVARETHDG